MVKKQPSKPIVKTSVDSWAKTEFSHMPFQDRRLEARVKKIASDFARKPTASIPQASENWAATKAAYRFFDNDAVSEEEILANHLLATIDRIRQEKLVFVIQDTTDLNYTDHFETEGLGPIGNSAEGTKGVFVHGSLATTPQGVPLGLIDTQFYTRDSKKFGDSKKRNSKPIEEKESFRWLRSFQVAQQLALSVEETQVVSIADREADIYELFAMAAEHDNKAGLLVRSQHNRGVENEEAFLWKRLHNQPVAATLGVNIPGGNGKRARTAHLSIRFAAVTLKAPLLKEGQPSIDLWAVEALEQNAPSGTKPLCWKLLTNVAVLNAQDAIERVNWYKQRWLIEVFHKVLKSGCKIEERQLETIERLRSCAALDLVVAWRVLFLTTQSRYTPNAPASAYFAEHEWKALYCYIHRTNELPAQAPDLRQTVRWIAQLGGFLGRKGDGTPGPITLWRGLSRLHDIAEAYLVFNPPTCG
jgi:hypothetical protein